MKIHRFINQAASHLHIFEKEMRANIRKVDKALEVVDIVRGALDRSRSLLDGEKTSVKITKT